MRALALGLVLAPLPGSASAQGGPAITSIIPVNQRVHELITIHGSGFGLFDPATDRVTFTGEGITIEAGAPYVWRDDFIQVRVPPGDFVDGAATPIPKTALEVRVENAGGVSAPFPFRVTTAADGSLPPFEDLTQMLGLNLARTKDGEVGDVNGDSLPDLIDNNSNNEANSTHSVLRTNIIGVAFGAMRLEPLNEDDEATGGPFATTIPEQGGTFVGNLTTYDSDLADLTNDGFPELVQAYTDAFFPDENIVRVLMNDGDGSFTEATSTWLPSEDPDEDVFQFRGDPDDVAHADLDHDGFIDVGIAERFGPYVSILFNQSGATFGTPVELTLGSGSIHDVFFIDADADGYRDVLAVNELVGGSTIVFNQEGSFPGSMVIEAIGPATSGGAADLNGDGLDDYVVTTQESIDVRLNTDGAPGTFSQGFSSSVSDGYDVELRDVDLDGDVDIVAAVITDVSADTIRVFLNDGTGDFSDPLGTAVLFDGIGPYERLSADTLDLDVDGDLDLYVTGADGEPDPPGPEAGKAPNQLFENTLRRPRKAYVTNRTYDFVEVVEPQTGVVLKRLCSSTTPSGVECDEIGIGRVPWGVAVNGEGKWAYVTNSAYSSCPPELAPECNSVTVIHGGTDIVTSIRSVGQLPIGVAVNAAGTRVYVASLLGGEVTVLTAPGNPVGSPIPVGVGAKGIAVHPDDDRVYVTNSVADTVTILDVTTDPGQVLETLDLLPQGAEGPTGVAVSPDGRWIYVTNVDTDNVAVIERTGTGHVLHPGMVVAGDHPLDVAFAPDSQTAYVVNWRSHSVTVIDTATRNVVGTVALPPGEFEAWPMGVAVDPRTGAVLVAKSAQAGLVALDPVTLRRQAEIPLDPLSDPTAFGQMIAPVP